MLAALPILLALLTGILLTLFKRKSTVEAVHLSGTLLVVIATAFFLMKAHSGVDIGFWLNDSLSKYFTGVIGVIYLLTSFFSIRYFLPEYLHGKLTLKKLQQYYLLLHVFVATMFLTVLLNNLGLVWVAIELTTLTSALLVGFYNTKTSLEAAWKYIFLCSVGIALALFGIILIFYATEQLAGNGYNVLNWTQLMVNAKSLNLKFVKLAFIFIAVGYGTKVGLAPMHTWLPDAHSQAPSPVSAMLSAVLLNCALYGVLRFQIIVNTALGSNGFTSRILIAFGLFSIVLALPFLLVQNDVKRLLAYSSIEHMGFITLAFGIGGKLAIAGALLHVLFHALAKSGMFFTVGDITNHWHTKKIARIKGVGQAFPLQGWTTFILLFALAGSPPFGLFRSEFLVLTALVNSGKWLIALIVLGGLVAAFAGLVYHFGRMITGEASPNIKRHGYMQPLFVLVPLGALLIFGLWLPTFLDSVVTSAGNVLMGGIM